MKRGVLHYLEQQRDQQVTSWLVHLQAACMGHLARQKYRKLKVNPSSALLADLWGPMYGCCICTKRLHHVPEKDMAWMATYLL